MIVIAIIGIMASVAIPSYKGYVNTTKMSLVKNNAYQLDAFLKNAFANELAVQTLGLAANTDSVPIAQASLIAFANEKLSAKSPEGGVAFAAAANNDTGVIGVTVTTATSSWTAGDTVQISVPAYITLNAESSVVTFN